ncbi:MAG TPA: GatB/YqeY domain-containing protein [Stellaceae bacterium]|nr:GatB/YqeY domain-containing protein [Stellaceae bacterium]
MLRQTLSEALKTAMKARDQRATSTLRMILAALKDKDIAARGTGNAEGIGEPDILGMLQGMVKQRRDSITLYQQGNRPDLVEQEAAEIVIIEGFLPQQLSGEAMGAAIRHTIGEIGAAGIKDMGRTMAALKERYSGQMDFQKASAEVKQLLTA